MSVCVKVWLRSGDAPPPAASSDVRIHQWMRVPQSGLIARAQSSMTDLTGIEHLQQWETSADGPIGFGRVFVDTRGLGDEALALISVADN